MIVAGYRGPMSMAVEQCFDFLNWKRNLLMTKKWLHRESIRYPHKKRKHVGPTRLSHVICDLPAYQPKKLLRETIFRTHKS